ncbi:MAG: hypothetical protein MUD01_05670 [Chloroflexaceae bacterium]|nr:hypothetical protein [Chloroflexaceae bacterium]
MLLILAACGGGDPTPTPTPAAALPAAPPAAEEAPPAPAGTVVRGDDLPGRLLFVQRGTVWLWEGREGRPLLGDGQAWQPAWAPDGLRFAYVRRDNSFSDLWLADANGRNINRITNNGTRQPPNSRARVLESRWSFYPAFSPDGTRLVMASQFSPPVGDPAVEYNLALYTIGANGSQRRQVFADDNAQLGRTVYAPQGGSMVFTRVATARDGQSQLYRLNLRDGTSVAYPGAPEGSYDPAFNTEGTWLAFTARTGEGTDIYALPGNPGSTSTPTAIRLTSLGKARAPAFSPDGTRLAFLAIPEGKTGFELFVVDLTVAANGALTASEPRQVTVDLKLDADSGVSWAAGL